MKTVRVHIGPLKTGTTTVQHLLGAHRRRLAAAGILYPDDPAGQPTQLAAACDFVAATDHPWPPMDAFHRAFIGHQGRRRRTRGALKAMLAAIDAHDGDAVISAEMLSLLSPELAADFVARLPADHVEVVLVRRAASALLPSWYAESVKRLNLPDFATYTRQAFAELAAGAPSGFDFIDNGKLARTWAEAGADVVTIDALDGLSDAVVEQTCTALTPGLAWHVTPGTAANVALSAVGVELWRAHLAGHRRVHVGAAHVVRERMPARYPATASGPKLRLTPAAAAAFDAVCAGRGRACAAGPGTDDPGPPSEPVLPDDPVEPSPPAPFDVGDALAELARWQRRADRRWWLLDIVSRLAGPGPLMRMPS